MQKAKRRGEPKGTHWETNPQTRPGKPSNPGDWANLKKKPQQQKAQVPQPECLRQTGDSD
jgi:hypothetical protein